MFLFPWLPSHFLRKVNPLFRLKCPLKRPSAPYLSSQFESPLSDEFACQTPAKSILFPPPIKSLFKSMSESVREEGTLFGAMGSLWAQFLRPCGPARSQEFPGQSIFRVRCAPSN